MKTKLVTVRQLAEVSPAFTENSIRQWLFYDTDGFRTKCAIKIGAKVLLDLDAVGEWLDDHREAA